MDRTNNHTPDPGLPNAKNPKRNTHANIAMSITRLMPKRPKKNGINKIQNVSLICDMEIRILACCTPNVSAYSGIPPKEKMKGLANPLVICKQMPRHMEKMKTRPYAFAGTA